MPRVVKFSDSETIVESWGLSLESWDTIVRNKVTYKGEGSSDIVDVT